MNPTIESLRINLNSAHFGRVFPSDGTTTSSLTYNLLQKLSFPWQKSVHVLDHELQDGVGRLERVNWGSIWEKEMIFQILVER